MTVVRGSILLVDDEEKILKRLGRALKDDGHDVALASNAREAMRGMADRQFDLVVVDNLMPGMSGLDMVREVMTSSSEADRPQLVLMTAHGSTQLVRDAFKVGVEDFEAVRGRRAAGPGAVLGPQPPAADGKAGRSASATPSSTITASSGAAG